MKEDSCSPFSNKIANLLQETINRNANHRSHQASITMITPGSDHTITFRTLGGHNTVQTEGKLFKGPLQDTDMLPWNSHGHTSEDDKVQAINKMLQIKKVNKFQYFLDMVPFFKNI